MGISYSSLYQKCVEYDIQPVSEKPQWPKHIRYYILGHWYLSNRELADRTGCPIDSVRRLLNSTYGPGWRTKIMKREMEVNA